MRNISQPTRKQRNNEQFTCFGADSWNVKFSPLYTLVWLMNARAYRRQFLLRVINREVTFRYDQKLGASVCLIKEAKYRSLSATHAQPVNYAQFASSRCA